MANKIYIAPETATTWTDTTGDLAMTLNNLATVTGRQGAQKDLGSASRSGMYAWRAWVQFATNPTVGKTVEIYLKTSDGTHPDNDDGTGDIALSSTDKLKNLRLLGLIVVDEALASIEMVKSGVVFIGSRYVNPVFYNATGQNLKATNNLSGFSLTPIPDEVQ